LAFRFKRLRLEKPIQKKNRPEKWELAPGPFVSAFLPVWEFYVGVVPVIKNAPKRGQNKKFPARRITVNEKVGPTKQK